jgi:hypothetical protein
VQLVREEQPLVAAELGEQLLDPAELVAAEHLGDDVGARVRHRFPGLVRRVVVHARRAAQHPLAQAAHRARAGGR